MKITLLEVNDFKRIKSVVIEPGEKNLILVGGNNTHGKSSLLGAMAAAMGGKKEVPEDPIRHGEKRASIRVVFDDGALIVRRRFTPKGTTIEVTSEGAVIKSPQKMLDKLIGARFIDPMAFSRLSAKEQREVMLGCVDLDIDLDENIAAEKVAYVERRDINRDIKKLQPKVDARPPAVSAQVESTKDVQGRIDAMLDRERKASAARADIVSWTSDVLKAEENKERLQKKLKAIREELKEANEELGKVMEESKRRVDALQLIVDAEPTAEELATEKAKLSELLENGDAVTRYRDWEKACKELDELEEASQKKTEEIDGLKEARVDALANAKMPIPGLTFDDEGLQLNGSPFAQASGAERLRASIAISWALKPDLQDIWVEDGALLDENSLELVSEFAKQNDLRVWLERVGESDDGAIIMKEGEVKP